MMKAKNQLIISNLSVEPNQGLSQTRFLLQRVVWSTNYQLYLTGRPNNRGAQSIQYLLPMGWEHWKCNQF